MLSRIPKGVTQYLFRGYLLLSAGLMLWTLSDLESREPETIFSIDHVTWAIGFYAIFRLAFDKTTRFGIYWLIYLACAACWDIYSFASVFEFDSQLPLQFWLTALLAMLVLLVPQYLGIYLYAKNYNERSK